MTNKAGLSKLTRPEPKPGEWLKAEEFAEVVRLTPLVAIDLVARSVDGRVLVGLRKYEPAKGVFFVPGGRISKNESQAAAFKRLTRDELGVELDIAQARLLGVYDHFYSTNRFELDGFGTHYVTLGYEFTLSVEVASLPTDQHGHYVWQTVEELLSSPQVHENTKRYFRR